MDLRIVKPAQWIARRLLMLLDVRGALRATGAAE
jgi:hypothetical protein